MSNKQLDKQRKLGTQVLAVSRHWPLNLQVLVWPCVTSQEISTARLGGCRNMNTSLAIFHPSQNDLFQIILGMLYISKPRAYNNDKCISDSTPVVHQFNPRLATDHPIHLYLFNFTSSGLDACARGLYSSLLM